MPEDTTAPEDEFETRYLDSIRALAATLGRPPTTEEFGERTEHTSSAGVDRFGSWSDTITAAGLDPTERPRPDRPSIAEEEYIAAVQELAATLERVPISLEMDEQGAYSHTTGANLFGSWAATVEAAGLTPTEELHDCTRRSIADEEYLDAIRDLEAAVGRPPTSVEMNEQGEYSANVGQRRWGTWGDAVAAAGFDPDAIPASTGESLGRAEYVDAIQELATDLGRPPKSTEMNEQGEYTSSPAYTFWDSWGAALNAAGFDDE